MYAITLVWICDVCHLGVDNLSLLVEYLEELALELDIDLPGNNDRRNDWISAAAERLEVIGGRRVHASRQIEQQMEGYADAASIERLMTEYDGNILAVRLLAAYDGSISRLLKDTKLTGCLAGDLEAALKNPGRMSYELACYLSYFYAEAYPANHHAARDWVTLWVQQVRPEDDIIDFNEGGFEKAQTAMLEHLSKNTEMRRALGYMLYFLHTISGRQDTLYDNNWRAQATNPMPSILKAFHDLLGLSEYDYALLRRKSADCAIHYIRGRPHIVYELLVGYAFPEQITADHTILPLPLEATAIQKEDYYRLCGHVCDGVLGRYKSDDAPNPWSEDSGVINEINSDHTFKEIALLYANHAQGIAENLLRDGLIEEQEAKHASRPITNTLLSNWKTGKIRPSQGQQLVLHAIFGFNARKGMSPALLDPLSPPQRLLAEYNGNVSLLLEDSKLAGCLTGDLEAAIKDPRHMSRELSSYLGYFYAKVFPENPNAINRWIADSEYTAAAGLAGDTIGFRVEGLQTARTGMLEELSQNSDEERALHDMLEFLRIIAERSRERDIAEPARKLNKKNPSPERLNAFCEPLQLSEYEYALVRRKSVDLALLTTDKNAYDRRRIAILLLGFDPAPPRYIVNPLSETASDIQKEDYARLCLLVRDGILPKYRGEDIPNPWREPSGALMRICRDQPCTQQDVIDRYSAEAPDIIQELLSDGLIDEKEARHASIIPIRFTLWLVGNERPSRGQQVGTA